MNGLNIPDIPRLYTALAEWLACLLFIFFLKKRLRPIRTVIIVIGWLATLSAYHYIAGRMPLSLWILGMLIAIALMFLFIFVCCEISAVSALCWCGQAFIIAEFAASFEWQIFYYISNLNWYKNLIITQSLILVFIYAALFTVLFFIEKKYRKNRQALVFKEKDIFSIAAITLVVFAVSNISFIAPNSPFSGRVPSEIFFIRTLVDLCGIIMIYSYREQKLWSYAKVEIAAMQNLFNRQYEQYCLSKESIEIINRKHHDLKHQIGVIRQETNPDKRNEYLQEMEDGMKTYEAQNKTGNSVLDTVLNGKSLTCIENNITFTCVANGELLDFMDVMDICSIFGNALDNAIESQAKVTDNDKKLIKLLVYSQNDLLIIKLENYFEGTIKYEHGELITTKSEKNNHGFGIKSIKHSVRKYGGSMRFFAKDNWFTLCILFPIDK